MKKIIFFFLFAVMFSTLGFAQVSNVFRDYNSVKGEKIEVSWITPKLDDMSEIRIYDGKISSVADLKMAKRIETVLPIPGERQSVYSSKFGDITVVVIGTFGEIKSINIISSSLCETFYVAPLNSASLKKETSVQSISGVDLPVLVGYENLTEKGVELSDIAQEGKSFKFFMNTTTLAGNRYMKLAAPLGRDITFPKGSKISGNMMVPAPLGDVQLSVTLKKAGVVIMNSALYQISKGDWRRQSFQFPEIDGVFDEVQLNFSYLQNESGLRNLFLDGVYVVTGTTEVLIDDCNGTGSSVTKPGVTTLGNPLNGMTGVSITPTFTYNQTINTTQYQLQVLTKNGTVVYDQKNAAVTTTLTTPLAYNTQYDWRVKCWNGSTPSDNWSATFSFTTITQVVSVPVFTIASRDDSQNFITLNWSGGEVEFQLMNMGGTVLQNPSSSVSPFVFSSLADGDYQLRGRFKNPQSDWSQTILFKVRTQVVVILPTIQTPTNNSTGNPVLTVVSFTGNAQSYEIMVARNSEFTNDPRTHTTTTSPFSIPGLAPSTTYYLKMRAKIGNTYSAYTATINFMTIGTTGVDENNSLPTKFNLLQNYPNPFNPSTLIQFSLPASSLVKISIFDVAGREVKQLINQEFSGGTHSVRFDGVGMASGMYIYAVQTRFGLLSKKMTLVK
ncbi:MAG: hypothetical protein LiPW41_399 [Parcubacteria group bacterium LiPW_41]|nr:MAG: hypothetical protein LiPW41_399 [Parcubacteria group bacterium LiPW_41]